MPPAAARAGPRDGHPVALLLNIGDAAGAAGVATVDAEGVGLFRTEFLYLDRQEAPSVDEQVARYSAVFDAMGGRKIVVRTLDAGADKPLPFLGSEHEPNPALGVRGLRTARRAPEVLADQLAALGPAQQATGAERVGDGADGRHRGRGEVVRRPGPRPRPARRRGDGRDPGRRAARAPTCSSTSTS